MREMLESLYILLQLIQYRVILKKTVNCDMFNLILLTTLHTFNITATTTTYVEAGKGLFGISYGIQNTHCLLCHFRSPAFFNLQSSKQLISGIFLSDVTAILGSLDIVFGEIDR